MPRTIESILDAHHAANERREAGQPIWDRKLRIKQCFTGSNEDSAAVETAQTIANALKTSSWATADKKQAEKNGDQSQVLLLAGRLSRVRGLKGLNATLDVLYDLADADRVWIE